VRAFVAQASPGDNRFRSDRIEQIEGKKAGLSAAKQKIVEPGSAFCIDASNFPI
jgi:hypothetical protein